VAGVAASLAIVALVLMSVKPPPLRVDEFARSGQVTITVEMTDEGDMPPVYLLETDSGQQIPMVWIAQAPQGPNATEEDSAR
jgi:hypothetical protein